MQMWFSWCLNYSEDVVEGCAEACCCEKNIWPYAVTTDT